MPDLERVGAKQAARRASEAAMLEAATRLLLACPAPDVLASLKPVDVVRTSVPERTTGAFYNIWPTQEEFRRALLDHVLTLERFAGDEETRDYLRGHADDPAVTLAELIRVGATVNSEGLRDDPAVRLQVALWTRYADDGTVRAKLHDFYRDVTASVVPLYELLLHRTGRQVRPPYDVGTVAVALQALTEGLHLRWAVDPDAVPDDAGTPPGVDGDGRWPLFASLAYTLVTGMTEPVQEPVTEPGR